VTFGEYAMKTLAAILILACTGCATRQGASQGDAEYAGSAAPQTNPLGNLKTPEVEDIYIGYWHVRHPMSSIFSVPLLTDYELYANVTPRRRGEAATVSNLVELVRQAEPYLGGVEDCEYVLMRVGFVSLHPAEWHGEVTVFGGGHLVLINDDPVHPKARFWGKSPDLCLALFRVVMDERPEVLHAIKEKLEERNATDLLRAYPFDELPAIERAEPPPGEGRVKAAPLR
jgi:hypothetical protein